MQRQREQARVASLIDRAVCGEWPTGDGHTSAQRIQKVYLRLVTLASSGVAFPSQERLAHDLGFARRDVRNALKHLEATGFLIWEGDHSVGKHGTVYRPIVKDRCRLALADPEVIFGDEVCTCIRCTRPGGTLGGDTGGESGGTSGGDGSAIRDRKQRAEENENRITFESDGARSVRKAWFEPSVLEIAREAIREVARDHCGADQGESTFQSLRDALDESLFWDTVQHVEELLVGGTPTPDEFGYIVAFVEGSALEANLL